MAEHDSNAILAEILRRIDAGEQVDIESICQQHPEIADDLRSYVEGDELLADMAGDDLAGDTSQPGVYDETARPRGQAGPSIDMSGQKFGRYEVKRQLGQGAMGAVYLARDTQLDRDVALKIPKVGLSDKAEFLARFKREAQSAAKLNHPNICPVFDFGEVDGQPFITMAYVEGEPLSRFVGRKQVDNHWVANVIRKIAEGLAHAHEFGVIHRDLKSANVLVDRKGEPIVTDFGLAGRVDDNDETRLTQYGQLLGTPAYMSPEQLEGESSIIGPPSDIYALGVILYELLAGELPFRGTMGSLIAQVTRDDAKSPMKRNPDADQGLCDLCLKMLSKKPSQRPASMSEVAALVSGLTIGATKPKPVDKKKQAKLAKLEAGKERVAELVQRGQFPQAIAVLEKMAALKDKDAADYIAWAKEELGRIKAMPQKLRDGAPQLLAAAQKMMSRHDYGQAAQLLQQIPPNMRSAEAEKLLNIALELQDEADLLITDLKDCVATRTYDGIEDNVKRLLELKPGNKFAKDLWEALQTYQSIPRAQRTYRFDSDGKLQPNDTGLSRGLIAGLTVGILAFAIMGWFMKGYLAKESVEAGKITASDDDPSNKNLSTGGGTEDETDGGNENESDSSNKSVSDDSRLKRLGLAMHNYHSTYQTFPPAVGPARKGGGDSNWRIELLPFLNEANTYAQIDFAKGFNDATNQQTLSQFPDPFNSNSLTAGQRAQRLCRYVAPIAPQTVMGKTGGTPMRDIRDGSSNTVMLFTVPAELAVPWASSKNLQVDLSDPMKPLRDAGVDIVTVLMCDGAVLEIPTGIDSEQWRRLLQYNDGKRIDWLQIDQMLETVKAQESNAANLAEWTDLFNGRDFTNWRQRDGSPVGPEWKVSDGTVRISSPGRDIFTKREFANFELEFEWAMPQGGNSGLFYRFWSNRDGSLSSGVEYELIDRGVATTLPLNEPSSGQIWPVPGARIAVKPSGQFNQSRIVANGSKLVHWLNGAIAAEAIVGDREWMTRFDKAGDPASNGDNSQAGLNATGPIGLQTFGSEVIFRNMRIRELPSSVTNDPANATADNRKLVALGENRFEVIGSAFADNPYESAGSDPLSFYPIFREVGNLAPDVFVVSGRPKSNQQKWGFVVLPSDNKNPFYTIYIERDQQLVVEARTGTEVLEQFKTVQLSKRDSDRTLAVIVKQDTFEVYVDDELVIDEVTVSYDLRKLVGLLRLDGGRVSFSDLILGKLVSTQPNVNIPGSSSAVARTTPLKNIASDSFAGKSLGQSWSKNFLRTKFLWIPPGQFRMGSAKPVPDEPDERPVDVEITHGLWVQQMELTQGEWRELVGLTPWMPFTDKQANDRNAATHMTWDEAVDFCQRLTDRDRRIGNISNDWEYRLPSEAEWEYFCRAGTTTAYSFGDDTGDLGKFAWWKENTQDKGEGYAHEVGKLLPNPWGLHDVHGNVFEYCYDSYQEQLPGGRDPVVANPPIAGKIARGGAWAYVGADALESNDRTLFARNVRRNRVGMRLVLAPVSDISTAGYGRHVTPSASSLGQPKVIGVNDWYVVPEQAVGDWRFTDGTLTSTANRGMSVAYFNDTFEEFELTMDVRCSDPANGGVYLRAAQPHATFQNVFEVHFGGGRDGFLPGTDHPSSGGIYLSHKEQPANSPGGDRDWTHSFDCGADLNTFRPGDWNKVKIRLVDQQLEVEINGRIAFWRSLDDLTVAFPHFSDAVAQRKGHIGLQSFIGTVQYRNISIQPLRIDSVAATGGSIGKTSPDTESSGELYVTNALGMKLRLITAGELVLNQKSGQTLKVDHDYYIGTTEVSRGQWKQLMDRRWKAGGSDEFPVTNVSWAEANEFCKRLTEVDQLTYSLPSLSEAKFAALAGNPRYKVQDAWVDKFQFREIAQGESSPWGLYDMTDNVTEWTKSLGPNPTNVGQLYVTSGSSFRAGGNSYSEGHRLGTVRSPDIGFRVVAEVPAVGN